MEGPLRQRLDQEVARCLRSRRALRRSGGSAAQPVKSIAARFLSRWVY